MFSFLNEKSSSRAEVHGWLEAGNEALVLCGDFWTSSFVLRLVKVCLFFHVFIISYILYRIMYKRITLADAYPGKFSEKKNVLSSWIKISKLSCGNEATLLEAESIFLLHLNVISPWTGFMCTQNKISQFHFHIDFAFPLFELFRCALPSASQFIHEGWEIPKKKKTFIGTRFDALLEFVPFVL